MLGVELLHELGPTIAVPANSSRFYELGDVAAQAQEGKIHIAWDDSDPYFFNFEYDESLIKYDEQYCTSVAALGTEYSIPALAYLPIVLRHLPKNPKISDIGCGQGEFVEELRGRGLRAIGFDPVLRDTKDYLHAKYWQQEDPASDLYVMRCVLPHIREPWKFLALIAESSPGALVLVEFQRLEWIIDKEIWYQLSHDHVNLFSFSDFLARYKIIDLGTFSNGEWGWVLLDPSSFPKPTKVVLENCEGLTSLFAKREKALRKFDRISRPLAIWGASGKGIVLAHALKKSTDVELIAIDAHHRRWNKYLEVSGVEVYSPERALRELDSNFLILVCNPNHFEEVKEFVQGAFEIRAPSDFTH